jgi:hypothetical protein
MMKKREMILALAGWALLLSACEKAVSDQKGHTVPVIFSTSTAGYDAADEGVRSLHFKKPETKILPLGNNICLYATFRPDTVNEQAGSELRASLENGQKVRLAAFKPDGTQEGATTTYTYTGGQLIPDGSPLGVEPGATVYRFVAYSYYGDKGAEPVEAGIAPSKDLVWGSVDKAIPNTYTGREVDITMKHKFSRVKVKIDAGSVATAITDIDDVAIGGGQTADLTVPKEGTLAATGTAVAYDVTASLTGTGAVKETPNYQLFYPSPTQVTIGDIELTMKASGTTESFSDLTAQFSTPLEAGKSYTLEVSIERVLWARSNIYWVVVDDDEDPQYPGYMTFAPIDADESREGYQGLLFKWGSLVGLTPSGGRSEDFSGLVYEPSGSGWITYGGNKATFNNFVPFWAHATYGNVLDNTHTDQRVGDICTYIDANYRLPAPEEFPTTTVAVNYRASNMESRNTGNHFGTHDFVANGRRYHITNGGTVFPTSGIINPNGGRSGVEYYAGYWTNFGEFGTNEYAARWEMDPVGYISFRYLGLSIRCVLAN